jgi:hypothetical protein
MITSQFFKNTQFILEEKILSNYSLDPCIIVANEGMWALVCYLGLLPIMQLVTCGYPYNGRAKETLGPFAAMCNFGFLENSAYAMKQMASRSLLIIETILIIISFAALKIFGITITKYASAA